MKKHEIQYSEPVREIMGNPPGKILRWGTMIIFAIFVLFISFAWLIKYPDIVPAQVEITTENPPASIMSKTTGRIMHLMVSDKQQVKAGEVLAVMENPASFEEVRKLKNFIDTFNLRSDVKIETIPDFYNLGELQTPYETFRKSISDIDNFIKNDYYNARINAVNEELRELKTYTARLQENEKFYNENYLIELNKFRRDSALNAGKSIAPADYENSKQALIRQQIELQKVRLDISAKNIEMINKRQLIEEYSIKRSEELDKLYSNAREALKNLRAELSIWENTYLLVSPVEGQVTFSRYWSVNQLVKKDETVMSVVPDNPGNYIGKIYLKMYKSGKVREGQIVNIKLNGYPYMEYGMLQGVIRSKALVPAGDSYLIEVELKNGLTTLYNRTLEFTQNMTGVAEIITDDRSLLEKMIYPFRYLISRNKR
ncbi:MAG TPA: HlyD family efflux transporter periplasmic adaptor subunit [Bacteroidales bacterium]|nr:HlyD family efflux transporter periplasmic adaptor subunit [Bacteroidales bacterium]HOK74886.1 HlyD family efflux transporter periplasmic adaptor subunit [Bacteroidales bacterium]HOM40203.1 HlyD family efflux transporter periplasmic adaptor subunit [Bacteroidales bacterium]HPP91700.1 HlyD family efflux transporter periplasmic adaptor subunit [Bacteroidales bacterium]HQK69931.1 HlyD family efflux transporter periplasmic adaptor subunit [Bacteroidales bacterium]